MIQALPLKIAIIVRTKNRPRLLTRCLQSLADQHRPPDEIILVNDGGIAVNDVVQNFSSLPLHTIQNKTSHGRAQAGNQGVQATQCDVIGFLDDDDRFLPDHLQRLEHAMHPFVTFVIIPIFAIANAGVSLDIDTDLLFSNNIAIGVALGLLVGKVVGVVGFTFGMVKLNIAPFPSGMNLKNLFGLGLLASIGFTMSLFITSLAFTHEEYMVQSKIGIFTASLIGGILGYIVLKKTSK